MLLKSTISNETDGHDTVDAWHKTSTQIAKTIATLQNGS